MSHSHAKPVRAPLSQHGAFTPIVALWLAALLGGCILVLPGTMVSAGLNKLPLALPTIATSQFVLAGIATLVGCMLGLVAARLIAAIQTGIGERRPADLPATEDAVPPAIEPVRIEEIEAAEDPTAVDCEAEIEPRESWPHESWPELADPLAEEPIAEPEAEPDFTLHDEVLAELLAHSDMTIDDDPPQPSTPKDTPVEEQVSEPAATPASPPAAEPATPQASRHGKAVNLIRRQATRQLAMPQLIERFAVALDERQTLAAAHPHTYPFPAPPADMAPRLKALAAAPREGLRRA